jgi:uncharacterized membrane protein YfcA
VHLLTVGAGDLALVIGAGFLAGVINTLAGSGSLVTLPLLLSFGLPAHVANGTNRVGVFTQGLTALGTIRRRAEYDLRGGVWIVGLTLAGALVGARVAVDVPERLLRGAILGLMAFMLVVLLVRPKRWLHRGQPRPDAARKPLNWLLFLAIGFYGGFIQAGVGIFLLSALVLRAGYNLVHANVIKLLVVFAFSLPVLAVFVYGGQVAWRYGLLLAAGQTAGAWAAARFATAVPDAERYIRWLLIAVVAASVVALARDLWG